MRHWIRLCEAFEVPQTLYHGTKPALVRTIKKQGLTAKSDVSWQEFGAGVYLASTVEAARQYGTVVFAVDVSQLDRHLLGPDDHELRDELDARADDEDDDEERPGGIHEASWLDSLRLVGQCQYLGDIPAAALKMVPRNFERRGKPPRYTYHVYFELADGTRDFRSFVADDEAWARHQAEQWIRIALKPELKLSYDPPIVAIEKIGRYD